MLFRRELRAEDALVLLLDEKALADVDDRFPAASDPARDLQYHRLPDARRFLRDAAISAALGPGRCVAGDAQRCADRAWHSVAAVRGHQGRTARLEILHGPPAVAG